MKFAQAYHALTQDYTQSAVDLTQLDPLYESIETIAQLLINGMQQEVRNSVRAMITRAGIF
jgi:hypothetical protein